MTDENEQMNAVPPSPDVSATTRPGRDPGTTLAACDRILILGGTGSGKTTLARELAAALQVPHVELDSLYFGPEFSTAPLPLLRERTSAAIAGDRWVTDGNKQAVRDLVWPRADTIVWLDYPLGVRLWRLAKRARGRTSVLAAAAAESGRKTALPGAAARGRERGAHGAPIARGPAARIPADVRRAGERAPRGGAPAVTAGHASVADSRDRGGHRSVVGGTECPQGASRQCPERKDATRPQQT